MDKNHQFSDVKTINSSVRKNGYRQMDLFSSPGSYMGKSTQRHYEGAQSWHTQLRKEATSPTLPSPARDDIMPNRGWSAAQPVERRRHSPRQVPHGTASSSRPLDYARGSTCGGFHQTPSTLTGLRHCQVKLNHFLVFIVWSLFIVHC
jgi:hypothetical protein